VSKRVLTGPRFVQEALRSPAARSIDVVFVDDLDRRDLAPLFAAASKANVRVEGASRGALDKFSAGVKHQGVVAIAGEYVYADIDELTALPSPLLIALDEITDPHNFGAIVRSAVAFGAAGIIVPKHRSATVTPVVVRTSAGATEHAKIAQVTNLQRTLLDLTQDHGFETLGLDSDGDVRIDELPPFDGGRVLVVGSEGSGLRRLVRERCERIVSIRQTGNVESLNASVATAIAIYELTRASSSGKA